MASRPLFKHKMAGWPAQATGLPAYFDFDFSGTAPGAYASLTDRLGNVLICTRALGYNNTPAYVRLANGTYTACAADTIRIEAEGLLQEGEGNNWYDCLNLNSFFDLSGVTVNATGLQSPISSVDMTGNLVTLGAGTVAHTAFFNFSQANPYTGIVFQGWFKVQPSGPTWVTIATDSSFTRWVSFDIQNLVVGDGSDDTDMTFGKMRADGNGWVCCMAFFGGSHSEVKGGFGFADSQAHATPVAGALPGWSGSGKTVGVWCPMCYAPAYSSIGPIGPMNPCPSVGFAPAGSPYDVISVATPADMATAVSVQATYSWCRTFQPKSQNGGQFSGIGSLAMGTAFTADSIYDAVIPFASGIQVYDHAGVNGLLTTGGLSQSAGGTAGPGYHTYCGVMGSDHSYKMYHDGVLVPSTTTGQPVQPQPSVAAVTVAINSSGTTATWTKRWAACPGDVANTVNGSANTDAGTGRKLAVFGDYNSGALAYFAWPFVLQMRTLQHTPMATYDFAHEAGVTDTLAADYGRWVSGKGFTHLISECGMVNILFKDTGVTWYSAKTAVAIWAQLESFFDQARTDGLTVIPCTLWGAAQVVSLWDASSSTMLDAVNADITTYAGAHGLTLLDLKTVIEDPMNPYYMNPTYLDSPTSDQLNAAGMRAIADYIKTTLGW